MTGRAMRLFRPRMGTPAEADRAQPVTIAAA